MVLRIRSLVSGLLSYTPIVRDRTVNSLPPPSARYAYSVWLRHFVTLMKTGVSPHINVVAEVGPGTSLGVGLCALLCGSNAYHAYDVAPLRSSETDRTLLEELIGLMKNRTPIPDDTEFPGARPRLTSYGFPSDLLSDQYLRTSLAPGRLDSIRSAISRIDHSDRDRQEISISYGIGRWDERFLRPASIDLILSQAVMEYFTDLPRAYGYFRSFLKPRGIMSHQIDFRSHGLAMTWDGHWTHSDPIWKLICGRRSAVISRHPCSSHAGAIEGAGFRILARIAEQRDPEVARSRLAGRFRGMADTDRRTASAHFIAERL